MPDFTVWGVGLRGQAVHVEEASTSVTAHHWGTVNTVDVMAYQKQFKNALGIGGTIINSSGNINTML